MALMAVVVVALTLALLAADASSTLAVLLTGVTVDTGG
jgi:hypothetical protein